MAEFLKENDDGSVTVTLDKGLEINGAVIKVLTLREPSVADQINAQKAHRTEADQEVALIANLAEISPDDVHRLKLRDYRRVQVALVGFTS